MILRDFLSLTAFQIIFPESSNGKISSHIFLEHSKFVEYIILDQNFENLLDQFFGPTHHKYLLLS